MVESAVRDLAVKNLAKMLEFLGSLVTAAEGTSKQNRSVDDAEIIKLLHTLTIAATSVSEEIERSRRDRHSFDARRSMQDTTLPRLIAELGIASLHAGTATAAGEDGSTRQRVIAEMCIQQAEHFRKRTLQLEREMAGMLKELEGIRHLLARQRQPAAAKRPTLVKLGTGS